MRNRWLVQGLISNWVSAAVVGGGTIVITYVSSQPDWAPWILRSLQVAALLSVITACWRSMFGVRATGVSNSIRAWLDNAGAGTKSQDNPDLLFIYEVTFNGKMFTIAQERESPGYIHFRASVRFTKEDNDSIESSSGGAGNVIRALRSGLALLRVGHYGASFPFEVIAVTKKLLITSDFNEDKFFTSFYEVESALNLIFAVITPPEQLLPASKPTEPQAGK